MLSSAVEGFFAVAEWLNGRLAEAEDAFESRISVWRNEGQVTMTAWADYSVSRLRRAQGRLDAAVAPANGPWHRRTTGPPPAAGPALVELAAVAYERNELDAR